MRAVMVMYDSLNARMLSPYAANAAITPNFNRLAARSVRFDTCYAGSLPCMPARRELHTGRYNFLHRSWGPIEPFDDSMPEILKMSGIHTHLASDHTHYWEDGGATYHTRYTTWEMFRGQEGDPWKGVVGEIEDPGSLIQFEGYRKKLYRQDTINRAHMPTEDLHPQTQVFDAGLSFMQTNMREQNWFLQIETFDPHEPFFSYEKYKLLYPDDYEGPRFDWPDYAPVAQTDEEIAHARREYMALVTMCDNNLGRVLDVFDANDMWKDTMLIVCTDHGFMLGEHGYWAKNYMPPYDEVVRTPLFIWDPRSKATGRRGALVQTIDLPVTILSLFDASIPDDMQGYDLAQTIIDDKPVREAALFGWHAQHVCVTDGRYVYMRAGRADVDVYEYTLMPTHMAWRFQPQELHNATLAPPFSFTKGCPVLKIPKPGAGTDYPSMLFDTKIDPSELKPLHDPAQEKRMAALMKTLMHKNDAPLEQFERLNLI
ncbi:MAG: sulfatase [Christensenellales bacterium]|jgi:arylsulfatase A-like enzyme